MNTPNHEKLPITTGADGGRLHNGTEIIIIVHTILLFESFNN
jgi:hypothetical protein